MNYGNILLIEDNQTLRTLYQQQLTFEGHAVYTAANAEEGMQQLERHPVDLLILDIILPDKNGLVFLEELRQNQQFFPLPVLLLTAIPDEAAFEKGRALGIVGYLEKDQITPQQLAGRVKVTLDEIKSKAA